MLVPQYTQHYEIMTTKLQPILAAAPQLQEKIQLIIQQHFQLDKAGMEHIMDPVLQSIRQKYNFYRTNFV
ncbi:hypothetical protein HU830_01415 [Lactobacillus sp. DCY120]|uniref:Uncharacterized protein n=1 Tax=Bombilactobacillus apium TaxID=2675299 RepID=A0A850R4U9_9LACO|nr:hypothetical protein [Bombilactobacillus apium]NVY95867.1 hypothetical protein [Bombilactobacillus apium]